MPCKDITHLHVFPLYMRRRSLLVDQASALAGLLPRQPHLDVQITCMYSQGWAACRRQAPRALRQYSSRCCGSVARAEDAEEDDEAEQDNALQGALRWAFTKTGLQGVAEALDDNWAVSVAIVVLYLASLAASFASGWSSSLRPGQWPYSRNFIQRTIISGVSGDVEGAVMAVSVTPHGAIRMQ